MKNIEGQIKRGIFENNVLVKEFSAIQSKEFSA